MIKQNKQDIPTEIVQPLLLKSPYTVYCVYAHVKCREPKKSSKDSHFKEDDSALPL